MEQLQQLLLDYGLTEKFKWRTPFISYQGNNAIRIGSFKSFCIISFFKGVLLQDTNEILSIP